METERPDDGTASSANRRDVIVKHFEFSSDKLRAGTLLQRSNGEVLYLLKGSPETVMKIVDPDSFVPEDVNRSLTDLAGQGLRVLAFAYRYS
jgi:magnesium-transporting ATPase (P-type)